MKSLHVGKGQKKDLNPRTKGIGNMKGKGGGKSPNIFCLHIGRTKSKNGSKRNNEMFPNNGQK